MSTACVRPARTAAPPSRYKVEARHLRWLYRHPGPALKGAVRLAISYARRTELFRYWIERVPSDFGAAFKLTKIDAEGRDADEYHVCVSDTEAHCCCLGFERYGRCKHIDACRAIAARS